MTSRHPGRYCSARGCPPCPGRCDHTERGTGEAGENRSGEGPSRDAALLRRADGAPGRGNARRVSPTRLALLPDKPAGGGAVRSSRASRPNLGSCRTRRQGTVGGAGTIGASGRRELGGGKRPGTPPEGGTTNKGRIAMASQPLDEERIFNIARNLWGQNCRRRTSPLAGHRAEQYTRRQPR